MHSFHITCRNSEVTARSADSVELSRARGILTRIEEIAREANLLSESFHQLSPVQGGAGCTTGTGSPQVSGAPIPLMESDKVKALLLASEACNSWTSEMYTTSRTSPKIPEGMCVTAGLRFPENCTKADVQECLRASAAAAGFR